MVKVYGYSDDVVVIEGSKYKEDEIGCYDATVRIHFSAGTVIHIGYPKPGKGVWWIEVEQKGSANMEMSYCDDEDAEIYSDIFMIDAEIVSHEVIDR